MTEPNDASPALTGEETHAEGSRPGLSFSQALSGALCWHYQQKMAVTRRMLLDRIRNTAPYLDCPTLDLSLGTILNGLVADGTLKRVGGKWYVPGERCFKES